MKNILIVFIILLTSQLNAQQAFHWGLKAGSKGTDVINDMAIMGDNIYATGNYSGTFTSDDKQIEGKAMTDVFLMKLDSEGNTAWVQTLCGIGYGNGTKLTTNENTIYQGGIFSGTVTKDKNEYPGEGMALFIASWNKQGKINWLTRIPYTGNATLDVLEVEEDGSILAGGMLSGTLTVGSDILSSKPGRRAYTFSLSPSGNLINADISGGKGDNRLLSVKYGAGGIRYLLFNTHGWMTYGKNTTIFNRDEKFKGLVLLKETNGEASWVKYMKGEDYIQGVQLNVTEENGVLVCLNYSKKVTLPDTIITTSALQDVAVVKYNDEGERKWLRQLKSPVVCYAMDARQTRDNKFLVTGYFRDTYSLGTGNILADNNNMEESMFLCQFDKNGKLTWNEQPGEQASAFVKSVAIGSQGDIYFAGGFKNELSLNGEIMKSEGKEDVLVAKYFNCGQLNTTIYDPGSLCLGETVDLSVSGKDFETFIWNDSVWGETLTVDNPGTYYVEAFDNKGCSAKDTIVISWARTPELGLPDKVTLSPEDEILLSANDGFTNYFWNDGTIGSELSVKYNNETDSSSYIVVAETFEGCTKADTTIVQFYTNDGLHKKFSYSSLEVYPNPVSDKLSWYFNTKKSQEILVKLFDGKGILVYSEEIPGYIPNSVQNIDMSRMVSGNYLLTLIIEGNMLNEKIVKK